MVTLLGWATGCASLPANTDRPVSSAFNAPDQTPLGQLVHARRTQAGARSDSGFRLLDGVEIALTSRLALVDGAQRSLDLQYYAIHADASTEVILQRLRDAARRGVRVRILLDDFNSVGPDAQVLRLAFEPNIEIRLFNPLPGSRNSLVGRILTSLHDVPRIQKRMHNKVFIADNAWGITGGRNLGDRYFGAGEKQNFVDLDVLAAGRIVRDMSASFDRYWNNELAYPVQTLLDKDDLEKLRELAVPGAQSVKSGGVIPAAAAAPAPGAVLPGVTAAEAKQADRPSMDLRTVELRWAPSTLLVDKPGKIGPGDDEVDAGDTVIDGLMSALRLAQKDVLIISPYFVPGTQMMAVYEELRKRGVRIRVLTNSLASNDAPAAHAGYERYRKGLLAMGVELYEMRSDPESAKKLVGSGGDQRPKGDSGKEPDSRASLHSKAVVIDNRLSIIGSMNLDLRSQLKNSEVALVIRGPAVAQELTRQIEAMLAGGAYRVEQRQGKLHWAAPKGAGFGDEDKEPGASAKLRLIVRLVAPFAPDEML
jgi:cardiolipin synthase C